MMSRTLAAALLAGGCLAAAGGGAYVAVRQNQAEMAPGPGAHPGDQLAPAGAVSDTEALVEGDDRTQSNSTPDAPATAPETVPPAAEPQPEPEPQPAPRPRRQPRPDPVRNARSEPPATPIAPRPASAVDPPEAPDDLPLPNVPEILRAEPMPDPEVTYRPKPVPPEPEFVEVVIPASAVVGLQVETPLSSERNEVEDRVDARVTRDVIAEGRVAIPAGSRVIGHVTLVERGGKLRDRARLGVRFHTLVLADGLRLPLRTEAIVREGDPPSGRSARKIGGAAAGGAILGAILGGGKGAAIGGAAGAGAGTAAAMAGDRGHATLPAGTTLTARLSEPVVIELDR